MSAVPATQVNMPPLVQIKNTNVKLTTLSAGNQLIFTESKQLKAGCIVATNSLKTKTISARPVIASTNALVDGKVVGIDVLTKLQQQNVGNIVSFTASKEFISNLTNPKLKVNKASNLINKSIEQSVFCLNNVSVNNLASFNVTTIHNSLGAQIKSSQEKRLLPKTTTTTTSACRNSNVQMAHNTEIKKFAPEMKGLLTGLSTALKTSTPPQQQTQQQQPIQLLKTTSMFPVTNFSPSSITSSKGPLLIAVKTTTKPSQTSLASTNVLPGISTFKRDLPSSTVRPLYHQPKKIAPAQNIAYARGATPVSLNKNPATTTYISQLPSTSVAAVSYYQKASSVAASINSGRINMFRNTSPRNINQDLSTKYAKVVTSTLDHSRESVPTKVVTTLINLCKNSNPNYKNIAQSSSTTIQKQLVTKKVSSDFFLPQHHTNLLTSRSNVTKTVIGKEVSTNKKENKIKRETSPMIGFTKLYEDAVRNVLNIRAFPEEEFEKENDAAKKELENSYKEYLETPTEFEKKFKREISRIFTNKEISCEVEEKKIKLECLESNVAYSLPESTYSLPESTKSNEPDNPILSTVFGFEKYGSAQQRIPKNKVDVDNLRFFSEFLNEQKNASQEKSGSLYSHTSYPWMQPMYNYEQCFSMAPYSTSVPSCYKEYPNAMPKLSNKDVTQNENYTNKKNEPDGEHSRMKLNTVNKGKNNKKKKEKETEEEINIKVSLDEEVQKINKKKTKEKLKNNSSNRSTPLQEKEKKSKAKEVSKIKRYTLRQRALALKKAKKLAVLIPKEPPKYILKELTAKNITKKEHFLGVLGLRRILKRSDKKNRKIK